ncbi:hypothetical protein RHMOL_Rhmol07G0226900 [Rhododendron molle]|uniref:Uncharacterized protein n=1 Tax=Rhododendron molle TaxID=49168 RepID=A0ACC0N3U3_RHOML|nr:hypothetical protein RHMOL_Rhmol07G0226900 [Rhododendron molle]
MWKASCSKGGDNFQLVTSAVGWFEEIVRRDESGLVLAAQLWLTPTPPSSIGDCNVTKWQCLPTGFCKFNCNGAFSSKDKQAAFGVLARDYSGKMMEVNYGRIRVSSALAAGAWAIRVTCAMTVDCGTQNFIIESDSLKDITMVNGERAMEWEGQTVLQDAKILARDRN